MLESAHEAALVYELKEMGLKVEKQVAQPFIYKSVEQEVGYRIDILGDCRSKISANSHSGTLCSNLNLSKVIREEIRSIN